MIKNRQDFRFLFTSEVDEVTAPRNLKQTYINRLKTVVFDMDEFQALEDEMGMDGDRKCVGGQSLRKIASTEEK